MTDPIKIAKEVLQRLSDGRQIGDYEAGILAKAVLAHEWQPIETAPEEKEAQRERMRKAAEGDLQEVLEYFDSRMDADHNGVGFVPNEEMRLYQMLLGVLGFVRFLRPISPPQDTDYG